MQKNRSKPSVKRTTRATTTKQVSRKQTSSVSALSSYASSPISTSRNFKSTTSSTTTRQTVTPSRKITTSSVSSKRAVNTSLKTSSSPLSGFTQTHEPTFVPKAKLTTVSPQNIPVNGTQVVLPKPSVTKINLTQPSSRSLSTKFEDVPDNGVTDGPGGIKRPISPSIQIWKFTPAAYAHVGVRIAGTILTGGFTIAGLTALFGTCDIPYLFDQVKIHAPILVPVLKASIVAPTVYHTLGGFRQLYQDFTAKGYSFKFQEQSSIGIAVLTLLSTLYFGAI